MEASEGNISVSCIWIGPSKNCHSYRHLDLIASNEVSEFDSIIFASCAALSVS